MGQAKEKVKVGLLWRKTADQNEAADVMSSLHNGIFPPMLTRNEC